MVLAAPEFVVAEPVEMLHEVEIAAELQHRMLADRMMRGEEGAEIQTRHDGSPGYSRAHNRVTCDSRNLAHGATQGKVRDWAQSFCGAEQRTR